MMNLAMLVFLYFLLSTVCFPTRARGDAATSGAEGCEGDVGEVYCTGAAERFDMATVARRGPKVIFDINDVASIGAVRDVPSYMIP